MDGERRAQSALRRAVRTYWTVAGVTLAGSSAASLLASRQCMPLDPPLTPRARLRQTARARKGRNCRHRNNRRSHPRRPARHPLCPAPRDAALSAARHAGAVRGRPAGRGRMGVSGRGCGRDCRGGRCAGAWEEDACGDGRCYGHERPSGRPGRRRACSPACCPGCVSVQPPVSAINLPCIDLCCALGAIWSLHASPTNAHSPLVDDGSAGR